MTGLRDCLSSKRLGLRYGSVPPALSSFGYGLALARLERAAWYAMPDGRGLAETSDAAKLQVLDDRVGDRPEQIVLARHTPTQLELAGLAKRLLDIEQEFVPRDRAGDRGGPRRR